LLAMDVNDDAHSLKKRSALENIASKLAPTKKRPREPGEHYAHNVQNLLRIPLKQIVDQE
jgi:hypothetical protein